MRGFSRRFIVSIVVGATWILLLNTGARGDDGAQVTFARGETKLDTLRSGAHLFLNEDFATGEVPDELSGMMFTRRKWKSPASVTLDVPAQATIYVLFNHGNSFAQKQVEQRGWEKWGELRYDQNEGKTGVLDVYRQTFASAQRVRFFSSPVTGDIICARNLTLASPSTGGAGRNPKSGSGAAAAMSRGNLTWSDDQAGPATRISRLQSEIKALYVIEQSDGMLGEAADLIATVDPESRGGDVAVSFATPVGPQMIMVLDDVIRRLRVIYPAISGAGKIEFSFEDKYDAHDGGSIGVACGTLLLSLIRGFDIDPQLAVTGDVSADGKVRAIGGVLAKLRGAKAAGCTIVAIPNDNLDQVIDAMIYGGISVVEDEQIIGISSLQDAAAVARVDRDPKLARAIALFRQIQTSLAASPGYLNTPDCSEKLMNILELAPNDISAKVLWDHLQHHLRRRLSALASEYYTFNAIADLFPTIYERTARQAGYVGGDVLLNKAITSLHRIRPMADLTVQPLIDAAIEFTEALQESTGITPFVQEKAREFLRQMTALQADEDLAQKMLKEGI